MRGLQKKEGLSRMALVNLRLPTESQKLRCVGEGQSCDRCSSRETPCVVPSSRRDSRARTTTRRERPIRRNTNSGHHVDPEPLRSEIPQVPDTSQQVHLDEDEGLQENLPALDPETSQFLSSANSNHDVMVLTNAGDPAYPSNPTSKEMPNTPTLDGLSREGSNDMSSGETSSAGAAESDRCFCVKDLLDIVQKLEDDVFRLRTLGFDHILKLQKYMIFHCCKALDCPNCANSSSSATVILIICDRITSMFRCLSRRIRHQLLNGEGWDVASDSDGSEMYSRPIPDHGLAETSSPSVREVSAEVNPRPRCNPDMFSPEFKAQYSVEEQLHMIRVLAKIQVRNSNQLLVRISETSRAQNCEARFARIMDMTSRLQQAAESIDDTFQKMLQNLVD